MTDIVAIGGFGSTPKQYDTLAEKLHDKFGPDLAISGVNFFTAVNDPESLADKIHQRRVITHSAGAYAVAKAVAIGATPARLDMIAPPTYDQSLRLMVNGIRYDRRQKRLKQNLPLEEAPEREASQILRHPRTHLGAVAVLGKFQTLNFATSCVQLDVPTRVGLMDQDGLFRIGRYPREELEYALETGVGVRLLSGDHTRFTREPSQALDELDRARNIELEDYSRFGSSELSAIEIGRAAAALSGLLLPIRRGV